MDLSKFKKHNDWTKIWAGGWSFLTCSHFGDQYTKEIIFGDRPFSSKNIIFVSQGRSAAWMRQEDRDILGHFLSSEVVKNPDKVSEVCVTLKKEVDLILALMDAYLKKTEITKKMYQEFWDRILFYYKPHINVKYVVDYLEPVLLKKYLPQLEEARLYAEPVFKRSEDIILKVTRQVALTSGYSDELILCLTKNELYTYFDTGVLPPKDILELRNSKAAFLFDTESSEIVIGDDITMVEQITTVNSIGGVIKGSSAYIGKVQGKVKIVLDPDKSSNFNKGDILVTGMTRPEYLPLMEKAAAIVTDAGGILSHAAITAREMKKPCVIGTQVATKTLKDGDMVEVDGEKGIVTILN